MARFDPRWAVSRPDSSPGGPYLRPDKGTSHISKITVSFFIKNPSKNSYFLYISKHLIKDKNMILENKSSKYYLYRSNYMIKNNNFKLFGILPKHYEV